MLQIILNINARCGEEMARENKILVLCGTTGTI
jgi:hypothetical protein